MRSQSSLSFRSLGHTHGPVGGTKGLVRWAREAISELIERASRRVLAVRTHLTDSPIFFYRTLEGTVVIHRIFGEITTHYHVVGYLYSLAPPTLGRWPMIPTLMRLCSEGASSRRVLLTL